MKKKTNRISVIKFEKTVDKDNIVVVPLDGVEDANIEITKTIPLKDMIEFVEVVAESCVDMNDGEYTPQAKDFAIKREVLTKYANFTMPTNIEKQYEFIYGSYVYDIVMEHINFEQFREILNSIDEKIKYMLDCITSISASNTAKLLGKLDTISEQSSAMFDSIKGEDIAAAFKNIDTIANMDEAKIAHAVKEFESVDKE